MRNALPHCGNHTRVAVLSILAALGLVLTACSSGTAQVELRVFAAASLHNAFTEFEGQFEADYPNVEVVLNVAGSASLREQILNGAPFDVLAVANTEILTDLADADLIDEPRNFATNQLTIAVPRNNPGAVEGLDAFGQEELLIGLCAATVPCGDLADRVLQAAGVSAAVDTRAPDVRSLVTRIEADELDAGLVYVTDVRRDTLQQVTIAEPGVEPVAYPIATARETKNRSHAESFVELAVSARGQAILAEFGFGVP